MSSSGPLAFNWPRNEAGKVLGWGGAVGTYLRNYSPEELGKISATVYDYGIVGDGVTDDTAAWNTIIAAINAGSIKSLYVNAGMNILLRNPDTLITASDWTIFTAGRNAARLTMASDAGTSARFFQLGDASNRVEDVTIMGLGLWNANESTITAGTWQIENINSARVHLIEVYGDGAAPLKVGAAATNANQQLVKDCVFVANKALATSALLVERNSGSIYNNVRFGATGTAVSGFRFLKIAPPTGSNIDTLTFRDVIFNETDNDHDVTVEIDYSYAEIGQLTFERCNLEQGKIAMHIHNDSSTDTSGFCRNVQIGGGTRLTPRFTTSGSIGLHIENNTSFPTSVNVNVEESYLSAGNGPALQVDGVLANTGKQIVRINNSIIADRRQGLSGSRSALKINADGVIITGNKTITGRDPTANQDFVTGSTFTKFVECTGNVGSLVVEHNEFAICTATEAIDIAAVTDRTKVTISGNIGNTYLNSEYGNFFATRAALVAAVAAGFTKSNGLITIADGIAYEWQSGATAIPDLLGLVPSGSYTPLHFGCVGDNSTDDGANFNLCLAAYKTAVEAVSSSAGTAILDLMGKSYKTTVSLNFTGITSWGWQIVNGSIFGHCTGKAVCDFIGSRGGTLRNLTVYGDSTNKPSVGIQFARAASGGQLAFCDNCMIDNVSVIGYFSFAAAYFYGQETTTYQHCRFWNYDNTGYAALHVGDDNYGAMASDYEAPITTVTSFINNKYINCDYRYLPIGNSYNIGGITRANPMVITTTSTHTFEVGDTVSIGAFVGMTEALNTKAAITAKTGTTITLGSVDSSGYATAWSSGGSVVKSQTKPTVVIGRFRGHNWDSCYIVNYGSDNLEIDMTENYVLGPANLDFLFEGHGSRSYIRFIADTATRGLYDFDIKCYSVAPKTSVISTDSNGAGQIQLQSGSIKVSTVAYNLTPDIFDDESNYALYDVNLGVYTAASVSPASFAAFRGNVNAMNTGATTLWGKTVTSLGFAVGDGAGGAVTQLTSKSTDVTLDKLTGLITTHNAALGPGASVDFTVNNSTIANNHIVLAVIASTSVNYTVSVISVSAGRFTLRLTNITGGSLSQAVGIYFAAINAAAT